MNIKTSDGIDLHVQDWGKGRPIVLVTPWACTSQHWQYTIEDLTGRGYRCVTFDRRGHGRSELNRDYSFARLVKDVADVFEALDLREAALLGYSLGGAEAMGYLAEHAKGRVSKLVLLAAATPRVTDGIPREMVDVVRGQWREDFIKWTEETTEPFFNGDKFKVPALTKEWLKRMIIDTPLPVALAANSAMLEANLADAMRACRTPALVIHGDADMSLPVTLGRASAALLPNSKYIEIPDGPHGLPFTHRREILDHITTFLAS